MRSLLISLLINSTLLSGLCQEPSQQTNQPLSDAEKRQIITQLIELKSCRVSVQAYEEFVARMGELSAKEKEVWERALEVEKQAVAVAEKERDLYKDQMLFYKSALDVCRKQPGFWCRFWRVVSIGLGRCQ